MAADDDRRNSAQPVLVRARASHPIVEGLPFDAPPSIGGYNEFVAAPGTRVILEGDRYRVSLDGEVATFERVGVFPLLVLSEPAADAGTIGRRACLATDVAPHWVGGLVDWGDARLTVSVGGAAVEIGNDYARLFRNLLLWALGGEP